jgi:ribosomal subunit interface protein
MQSPPSITFRDIDPSPAIKAHINKRIEELEHYHPRIISCDVVVQAPQKPKVTGREYGVQLTVRVPGPDIRVSRSLGRSHAAEDVNLVIHEVFDAARRKLKEQNRRMGGVDVKQHPPILHGTVDRLFEGEGYGFIKADDGREVYFERDNLTGGDWNILHVDMKVRFREEMGEKGAYATNVTIRET